MRRWLGQIHPTGAAVSLALLIWSGALALYACTHRYEVTAINPRQVTKLDRLTGHLELCTRADRTSALVCQPAETP